MPNIARGFSYHCHILSPFLKKQQQQQQQQQQQTHMCGAITGLFLKILMAKSLSSCERETFQYIPYPLLGPDFGPRSTVHAMLDGL